MLLAGCDSVYHYVVFPSEREEFILVPNMKLMANASNGKIRLGEDKQTIVYDAKEYKIEIKYMTDYQLNNFEFPDQSKSGQFSTNPFTYGDWVDPDLGYIPHRFTVFKVTIYNYAGGKINFDPESAVLTTDRGDQLPCYGREEKGSRNYSMEAYFKRRKGTSGIDDDVFESRMGIVRRTVHYLGKPIFRGDVRDGLIVFDPLVDEVEQVKLSIKDFILGYDENNQASEFGTFNFYFTKVKFEPPKTTGTIAGRDTTQKKNQIVKLAPAERPGGELRIAVHTTNVSPIDDVMRPLTGFLSEQTNFKVTYQKTSLQKNELAKANILLVLAEEGEMKFAKDQAENVAEFIKNGGFVIADERSLTVPSLNWASLNAFMTDVSSSLSGNITTGRVTTDHFIYSIWKKYEKLPSVDATLLNVEGREVMDYLSGVYIGNRLVAVISNRGYSVAWGEFGSFEARDGVDFTNQREFLANILYYALESAKLEKNK